MIYIGADHRGFELKEKIKQYLDLSNVKYVDEGTDSKDMVDYPQIASKVCTKMDKKKDKAILVCGSGIGMSMAANKFKGIRAGVCQTKKIAEDGKTHSNINVLVLAGDFTRYEDAKEIIETWLHRKFLEGRYQDRIEMIEEIEDENMK